MEWSTPLMERVALAAEITWTQDEMEERSSIRCHRALGTQGHIALFPRWHAMPHQLSVSVSIDITHCGQC